MARDLSSDPLNPATENPFTSWAAVAAALAPFITVTGAPLASPAFTGNPTAPTPTAGDNDTSIATTAFVTAAVAAPQAVVPLTGTAHTLATTHVGKLLTLSNAAGIALTVPTDASVPIAIGSYIDGMQLGVGQVTVAAAGGVTVTPSGLTLKARAQGSRFGLQKVAANTWSLFGDLAAS